MRNFRKTFNHHESEKWTELSTQLLSGEWKIILKNSLSHSLLCEEGDGEKLKRKLDNFSHFPSFVGWMVVDEELGGIVREGENG